MIRAKTVSHRKSHVANIDSGSVQPEGSNRDLGRRNSLSPNVISQGIVSMPSNVQRSGSFKVKKSESKYDRRHSIHPGQNVGGKPNHIADAENGLQKGNFLQPYIFEKKY